MTSKSERDNERRLAILGELMKDPANKECADCSAKGPRWASWSLGIFLCINCAGIHRSLGTHISKVKSATLDKWTEEQVEMMQSIGNARAKEIYEANVPPHYNIPNQGASAHALEHWIRSKYERKDFMQRGARVPAVPSSPAASPSPSPSRDRRDPERDREREKRRADRERRRAERDKRREVEERAEMKISSSPAPVIVPPPHGSGVPVHHAPAPTPAPKPAGTDLSELLGFASDSTPSTTQLNAPPKVDKASIMSLYATPMQPSHPGIHLTTNHARLPPNYNISLAPAYGVPTNSAPYMATPQVYGGATAYAQYGLGSVYPTTGYGQPVYSAPVSTGVGYPMGYGGQPQVRLN